MLNRSHSQNEAVVSCEESGELALLESFLAQTVASADEVEEEIRQLFEAFQG